MTRRSWFKVCRSGAADSSGKMQWLFLRSGRGNILITLFCWRSPWMKCSETHGALDSPCLCRAYARRRATQHVNWSALVSKKKKKKREWICIRPALCVSCKCCTHTLPYKCMHAPITSKWWARGRIGFRSRGCFKVRCFFYVWIVNELDSFHAGCMHVWWMWQWHCAMHFPQCECRAGVRGLTKVFLFSFRQTLPPGWHSDPHAWHVCLLLSARIYIRVTSLGAEIITTPVQRHFNALETIIIHVLLLFFLFPSALLTLIKAASPRCLRPQRFLSHDHHSAAHWNVLG